MNMPRPSLFVCTLVVSTALAQSAEATPAAADPYAPGRALIADIEMVVTPNGVQETFEAKLGGARQVVNVRGADRNNPLLVFIHGGPGAVETPIAWSFQRPWEDFFTVVQYDQRGAGKSFKLNDPEKLAPTLTFQRYRDDAIELIELLQNRYGKRKVILLGHSWGSAVGLAVAAKRPDLLYAYVGVGQVIDWRENERVGMALALAQARKHGNAQAVCEIEALSPYPDAGPFTIEKADTWRKWAIGWGSLAAYRTNADFYLHAARLSPEYGPDDLQAWDKGSAYTVTTLWPRLANLSFRRVHKLQVPLVMFIGRQDHTTSATLADAWMKSLETRKETIWFEHSAHLPMLEEPGRFLDALVHHVRPLADGD
jgi:proline iminopeptidase